MGVGSTKTWATVIVLLLAGCASDDEEATMAGEAGSTTATSSNEATSAEATSSTSGGGTSTTGNDSAGSTGDPVDPDPGPWDPATMLPSLPDPNPRGLLDLRGLIHTHSPYSHDACDGEPRNANDVLDGECLQQWRDAACSTNHDYIMLTDHRDSFSRSEYPNVMQYRPDLEDELIFRDDASVANRARCDDGHRVVILGGTESAIIAAGLEGHAPGRGDTYGSTTPDAMQEMRDQGAVLIAQHTEDWDVAELADMPFDGFEMYNLHANLFYRLPEALALLGLVQTGGEGLPHPDLAILPIWAEDPAYMTRWGSVLAGGAKRVTTMATDAHRNTFTDLMEDGERIDSFRRMMRWFSNHLLVTPNPNGTWNDEDLKDALRNGRLYGAFEYLGYPGGFDNYVTAGGTTHEMGDEIQLADGPEIVAVAPEVREIDPDGPQPIITLHVMRAIEDGFEEVADDEGELHYTPTEPGAYRVEVRMTPRHLQPWTGQYTELTEIPRVWIYANPFYIR
jgi:hypothetical protein